ncbi:hypothetical protein TSAR_002119 [Trichomalopsis sarcophagae]|uniref:Uncharacterized protein n=1 Tax=Trichomalopsis sarcophagae TaxID=543379 RepID=A0A232EEA9_9HYME|nr:hypothetical protein TSAR_002119 [Trichomalopsis sarcophagae]
MHIYFWILNLVRTVTFYFHSYFFYDHYKFFFQNTILRFF